MTWPEHTLGELARCFIAGGTPSTTKPEYWGGNIPWITGADFLDGEVILGRRYITDDAVRETATSLVPAGSLLVVSRTGVGKIAIAPVDVAISQDITGVPLRDCMTPMYALYAIRLRMDLLLSVQRGATIRGVTRSDVERLPIPVPAQSEQRRIVELLEGTDRLRRLRAEADAKSERILPALFMKMFGDPATNPIGWPTEPLRDVGELDRGRSRHRPRNAPALLDGPYPLIQTGDVANSDGRIRHHTQTYSEVGLAQSKMWPAGTLCITIAANIAKTGVLEFDACFPDSIVGFNPGPRVTTEYVQFLLGHLQAVLERRAPRVAQKNINLEVLRNIIAPIPPIVLQRHFSDQVAIHYQGRSHQLVAREKLERLSVSVLRRAFLGELTASWRQAHAKELLEEMEQQSRALAEVR